MVKLVSLYINTNQPEQMGRFYQGVLGMPPAWSAQGMTGFMLGDLRLEIAGHDQVSGPNETPARLFFDLLVEDTHAEFERIVGLGAAVIKPPYGFTNGELKLVIATLADPDGNYFQLVSMQSS